MHYALAAAFPGDPASRASSAYGANGVSHDLLLWLALERRGEFIVTPAGDDGQRSVQHLFRFVAGRRLGQLVGQRGYGFAFLAAKLIGDLDENFAMLAGDRSGPRIRRLERFAFRPNLARLRIGAQACLRQQATWRSTS
jgi:hypothetical protein